MTRVSTDAHEAGGPEAGDYDGAGKESDHPRDMAEVSKPFVATATWRSANASSLVA